MTTRSVAILMFGVVSCSEAQPTVEKNVTGINLTITFEPSLALDQLEVSCVAGGETVFAAEPIPDTPRALSPSGEVLAILFDDERADTEVDLTVEGYASGVHVVSESTQVTLVRNELVNTRVNLAADCTAATDCTSPGPCELPDDPRCVAGECAYTPVLAGTVRCALPGETELDGYCADGACAECAAAGNCVDPPGTHAACYDAVCDGGACAYTVATSRVCLPVSCGDGDVQNQRVCGDGGDCADTGTTSCDGYVCADGTSCRTTCSDDTHCASGYYCSSPSCVPTIANGEICVGEGNHACASGYCDDTRCCAGGDCCGDSDDCPASYSEASTCTDVSNATDCQGVRRNAACSTNHVCYSETVDDDSGCVGRERSCGTIAPVVCSGQEDQLEASCPADCTTVGCIDAYECIGTSCVEQVGLGDACTGSGQGSCEPGYKCDQGICCSAALAERCCSTSVDCANGLKCNTTQFHCYESCTPHTSDECAASTDYCSDGTQCVGKLLTGDTSCVAGGDCQLGNCVEVQASFGVCCETACTGMCLSCRNAFTSLGDGICGLIDAAEVDIGPPDLCSASTTPCGASSCACDGSGNCELGNNMPCTLATECASGYCECADGTCDAAQKRCSAIPCPSCQFNANGDDTCEGDIADTETDGSCAAQTCNGQGACHLAEDEECTEDWHCESDSCDCSGSPCTCGPPPCTPFCAMAVAYWPMEENTGLTTADVTGNGFDGTLYGPLWAAGHAGTALEFDGVDDHVDITPVVLSGSAMTIAAWFNADDFDNTDARIIAKTVDDGAQSHDFMISVYNDSGTVRLRARLKTDGTTVTLYATSGVIGTGVWYHAAMTYDGASLRLYQDAIEVGSLPLTGVLSNTAPNASIGCNPPPQSGGAFDGLIDDVRLWERALSASELTDLINL